MKTLRILLYFSIGSFLLSSLMIWFMPFSSFEVGEEKSFAYTIAIFFWLFMFIGFIFLYLINAKREKAKFKSNKNFLSFFSNKPVTIFDSLIVVALIMFALGAVIKTIPNMWISAALFTIIFSLEMHGIFAGKNYEYILETCK